MAATCTYEKYTNYNKNLELNINKNSELKNSMWKIKKKTRMPLPYMLNKVNNLKIYIQNFQWKIHFPFPQIVQKGIHNTFMVKVGSFTVSFKIMPFWFTSWPFKKVPYDIALTYNYSISTVIFWWCFCNTCSQCMFLLYCVSEELEEKSETILKHKNFNICITQD